MKNIASKTFEQYKQPNNKELENYLNIKKAQFESMVYNFNTFR